MMSTFDFKFFCDHLSKKQCKKECKIIDCESNCPIPPEKQGICAKDGYLYPSKCSLKCRKPKTKIRFKCKTPFSFRKCGKKCRHAKMSLSGHHHDHHHDYYHPKWNNHHNHYDNDECSNKNDCHDDHGHGHGHTVVTEKTLIAYPSYDPHDIYARLNENGKKMRKVQGMLHHNHEHNKYQDELLEDQNYMLNKGLKMQKEDEMRDHIQMDNQDQGYLQRLDLRDSIYDNKMKLNSIKFGQKITNKKQMRINNKLDHIDHGVDHVMQGVKSNGKSLTHLHYKMNAHDMQQNEMAKDLKHQIKMSAIHDEKLNILKDMHLDHDARQSQMMSNVINNGQKLNYLKKGQDITQSMISDHAVDMLNHADSMNKFAGTQMDFNEVVAHSMDHGMAHMEDEKRHMRKEKNHMNMEKKHMKMEAIHMADAEEHFINGHHDHHHHYHNHYNEFHDHVHSHYLKDASLEKKIILPVIQDDSIHMVGDSLK